MRSLATILLVGLAVALAAPPLAADSHVESTLVANEKAAWKAWSVGDPTPFEAMLAEDAVVILGDGSVQDRATVLEMIGSGACEVESYELSGFNYRALGGDGAVLTYHATQDAVCDGEPIPPKLVVSSVWRNGEGGWKNVLYQETMVYEGEE